MRNITEIIVHCTATEAGTEVTTEAIRKYHKSKGWKDIAYHYIVHLDGTIDAGRPIDQDGAHTSGHNKGTIGICYVGGLYNGQPQDTRTLHQSIAMLRLIRSLILVFPTITKISGHRDYNATACPCFNVTKWLERYEIFEQRTDVLRINKLAKDE